MPSVLLVSSMIPALHCHGPAFEGEKINKDWPVILGCCQGVFCFWGGHRTDGRYVLSTWLGVGGWMEEVSEWGVRG